MYTKMTVTLECKQNIDSKESAYRISQLIGFSMLKNDKLKNLHGENIIKPYVFDGLYPFEKDRQIKAGKLYTFHIKSPFYELIVDLSNALNITESDYFRVIHTSHKSVDDLSIINGIKTVTPCSSLIDGKPWSRDMGIMTLMDAIIKNTSHKYRLVYGVDIPHENWISGIKILSDKFVVNNYKCKNKNTDKCSNNGKRCNKKCHDYNPIGIIGYKIEVMIGTDSISLAVGNLLLGTGILEKNGVLGMGYTELI